MGRVQIHRPLVLRTRPVWFVPDSPWSGTNTVGRIEWGNGLVWLGLEDS